MPKVENLVVLENFYYSSLCDIKFHKDKDIFEALYQNCTMIVNFRFDENKEIT